jgi:hypothetical protein
MNLGRKIPFECSLEFVMGRERPWSEDPLFTSPFFYLKRRACSPLGVMNEVVRVHP